MTILSPGIPYYGAWGRDTMFVLNAFLHTEDSNDIVERILRKIQPLYPKWVDSKHAPVRALLPLRHPPGTGLSRGQPAVAENGRRSRRRCGVHRLSRRHQRPAFSRPELRRQGRRAGRALCPDPGGRRSSLLSFYQVVLKMEINDILFIMLTN